MPSVNWETLKETANDLPARRKLELIQQLTLSLLETTETLTSADDQRQALRELRRDLASLPVSNPADGISGRDHDRLLYGEPS